MQYTISKKMSFVAHLFCSFFERANTTEDSKTERDWEVRIKEADCNDTNVCSRVALNHHQIVKYTLLLAC